MRPLVLVLGAAAGLSAFVDHCTAAAPALGFLSRPSTPCAAPLVSCVQTAPGAGELAAYRGLHGGGARGDIAAIVGLVSAGADLDAPDGHGRTPLMVATYKRHHEAAWALIAARAPLDHVNNLSWTALIEAIVLGDGGPRHTAIVGALVAADTEVDLAERTGTRPLGLARQRGYGAIARILEGAGARP
ncbi:MAG: ankyrin repeat domain-containing protein [Rhodospirillales bacterium]|nr:ankyrin repeat domain-containing protein [Rhodospirillales bacterium]